MVERLTGQFRLPLVADTAKKVPDGRTAFSLICHKLLIEPFLAPMGGDFDPYRPLAPQSRLIVYLRL
jgi:hypothetical protein